MMCMSRILYEHLHKLSQVVTPDHKDLRIPKVYRYECPWPAAQADIALINAYKVLVCLSVRLLER